MATFIVTSYATLQPDPNADIVALLQHIAQQQSPSSAVPAQAVPSLPSQSFGAPASAIRLNIFWALSLFLSLCCALLATLVQQWARIYLANIQQYRRPQTRGRARAFLSMGIKRFGFNHVVNTIISVLHVSVLLFVAGLLEFFFSLDTTVAY